MSFPGGNAKFQKIKGKRKGSVNFVHEGFIYTKNNADSLKTRLRYHRSRDGCKGTAFIQDNHVHLNIKCQHEPEMSKSKKEKLRVKLQYIAYPSREHNGNIHDSFILS